MEEPIRDLMLGDYKHGDVPLRVIKLVPGKTKVFAVVHWEPRTRLLNVSDPGDLKQFSAGF